MTIPTDPLFGAQWHFPLLGDIQIIWDEYTGDGVNVGVYDDGVQSAHPDLDDNYDSSLHFFYDDPTTASAALLEHLGEPFDNPEGTHDHGTAVAGIIASEANNGLGGSGVAYDASITSVNIFEFLDLAFTAFDNNDEALGFDWYNVFLDALGHASAFDIMSNSWGATPLYQSYQNVNTNGLMQTQIGHYENAAATGRNGLGTVIVQAAGNDTLNANGDGANASRFTITVAATGSQGFATDYTNFGPSILLTAPASSVTTDRTGDDGYNFAGIGNGDVADTDYTNGFGGTSAATPTVSGVIALMLEANPDLGWRDIQNILAVTAAQTGENLDGTNAGAFEIGDWATLGALGGTSWNGGQLSFHASYGFGMLDAFAAVRMAEVWLEMFDEAQTSANEEFVSADYDEVANGAVAIPDGDATGVSTFVTVNDDIVIENVQVTVSLTHTWGNDLQIYLITPLGIEVPLFLNEGDDELMDAGWTWTFEITALLGFTSAGDWGIRVADTVGGDTGTLDDFQIDFYGQAINGNEETGYNDVHFISRDFLDVVAFDPSRSTIIDQTGGIDWLNFVGVNSGGVGDGDVELYMTSGGNFLVDGLVWGNLGEDFENAVMGDGDDTVFGNDLGNEILGMRGDDDFYGGDGDDTLNGGQGNDTLLGQNDDDDIIGGVGDDHLLGLQGSDLLDGGDGNDYLSGGTEGDLMYGGDGNDRMIGASGDEIEMVGGAGEDTVSGGTGNDSDLSGGNDNDRVVGAGGNDTNLSGGGGDDNVSGGSGNDTNLSGGNDNDTVSGGGGNDTDLFGNGGNDVVSGGAGNDTNVRGGGGNDTVNGGNGRDELFGDSGNDVMSGGSQRDTVYGGSGNDVINGGDDHDALYGELNNDTIRGGTGDDTIYGGSGDDSITGNSGSDVFVFNLGDDDDVITDFFDDQDSLHLDATLWGDSGLSVADMLATYGSEISATQVLLDFGGSDTLLIERSAGVSLSTLEDDIVLI